MTSQAPSPTARQQSPSSKMGASSKPTDHSPIGALTFLKSGAKYAVPALELVKASSASAAFPILGDTAGYALSIAKHVKEYKSSEWALFGEYVQQGVASAVVVGSTNQGSFEHNISQLYSVLVDVWVELQEFGRRRRLTFRGGRNERSLLKERLDRAFDLFKIGRAFTQHQEIARVLADTRRMNLILKSIRSRVKTAVSVDNVDGLHGKMDRATGTIVAIHADTRETNSTVEEIAVLNSAVHREALHANRQLTAMTSDMAIHHASASDRLLEVCATTSDTRDMIASIKHGIDGGQPTHVDGFGGRMAGIHETDSQLGDIEQALRSGVGVIQTGIAGLHLKMEEMRRGLDDVRAGVVEAAKAGEQRQNIARLAYAEGASWDLFRTRLPETCEGIVNDALDFLSAPHQPARILLLTGVAGCGKSTIAHTIAQCCDKREKDLVLLTSFFFRSGAVGRNNPQRLFSTVARDLTSQHLSVKSEINGVIASKQAVETMNVSNQFAELVLHPALSCARYLPRRLVIVIDAFDEGFSEDLLRILEEEIPKLPQNFQFLITSRHDRLIIPLRRCRHVTWRFIDVHKCSTQDDVAVFARHRFKTIARHNELEDWPQGPAMNEFLSRAAGLFIWAAVACDYIAESISPRETLDDLLQEELFDPDAVVRMDKLYAIILNNCPWSDRHFRKGFQKGFGVVIVSARPLSVTTIADLLGIGNILDTYKPLAAIISGVFSDEPLQLAHLSVREYVSDRAHKWTVLPDVSLEDQKKWAINEPQQHQNLALCCLRILSWELPRFHSATISVTNTSRQPGEVEPIKSGISEALQYACDFWIHHVVAMPSLTPELDTAITKLVKEGLLAWMYICAENGTFQGLKRVHEWYKGVGAGELIYEDANNLSRFLYSLSRDFLRVGRLAEATEAMEWKNAIRF